MIRNAESLPGKGRKQTSDTVKFRRAKQIVGLKSALFRGSLKMMDFSNAIVEALSPGLPPPRSPPLLAACAGAGDRPYPTVVM